jgi:hypothetical protein
MTFACIAAVARVGEVELCAGGVVIRVCATGRGLAFMLRCRGLAERVQIFFLRPLSLFSKLIRHLTLSSAVTCFPRLLTIPKCQEGLPWSFSLTVPSILQGVRLDSTYGHFCYNHNSAVLTVLSLSEARGALSRQSSA